MPKNNYKFEVKPEHFTRPESLDFLTRIDKFLNIAAIARALPSCNHTNTFVSRLDRGTKLTESVEQKAFAHDVGDLMNEIFWELGVGLGHFPRDPHKKYRYIFNDDSERLKDKLDELEKRALS